MLLPKCIASREGTLLGALSSKREINETCTIHTLQHTDFKYAAKFLEQQVQPISQAACSRDNPKATLRWFFVEYHGELDVLIGQISCEPRSTHSAANSLRN